MAQSLALLAQADAERQILPNAVTATDQKMDALGYYSDGLSTDEIKRLKSCNQ